MHPRALILPLLSVFFGSNTVDAFAQTVVRMNISNRPEVIYAYATVDPQVYIVNVKTFSRETQISSVPTKVKCGGISITGGFSKLDGNKFLPIGLIRSINGQISPFVSWPDGGVFSIQENVASILRVKTWHAAPIKGGVAVQGRPLLLFSGSIDYPLDDKQRSNRIAVGKFANGDVLFLGAFNSDNTAVTLKEFAGDAATIFGSALSALLNLDGGPSAFLYSQDVSLLPIQGKLTSYLCAELR